MSEALSSATEEDQVSLYQLKWVEWNGGFMPVVTQNENGPCPLLAICNILLLTRRIKIASGETVISSSNLMHLLGQCLIDSEPEVCTYIHTHTLMNQHWWCCTWLQTIGYWGVY